MTHRIRTLKNVKIFINFISGTNVLDGENDKAIHGFEKEPLMNDDLVRIGREALKHQLESANEK